MSKPTSAAAFSIERRLLFVATITGTFSTTGVFFDRASNLADLRLLTLWRQTMRLAQIIIFLVGALAAVGLLIMESMAS